MGWFGYKGLACKRCGFPVSPFVAVTEIQGYAGKDLKQGGSCLLFGEMEREGKRDEYLESLELVYQAVNFLIGQDLYNASVPEFARLSSPLGEESNIPLWLGQEMRKALAGKGSDLLVRILEAAKASSG